MLYHAQIFNLKSHTATFQTESAGFFSLPADSNFVIDPAKTRQSEKSEHTHFPYCSTLPCGTSSLQGGSFLNADFADSIVEKLWLLESNGKLNPAAGDNGEAIGPLQLHPGVLLDINKYYGTNFILADRRDLNKSKQIAAMYIAMWLELNSEEIAVRIFNGGPRGWRSKNTDEYYKKYLTTKNTKDTK
jgi:hypothetical protein